MNSILFLHFIVNTDYYEDFKFKLNYLNKDFFIKYYNVQFWVLLIFLIFIDHFGQLSSNNKNPTWMIFWK